MRRGELYARAVFWPTWGWNLLLGRILRVRNWWDEIVPGVWLGARPLARDVPTLAARGVRAIINTCAEFPGHVALYREFGIRQLHLPIVDFQHPDANAIREGLDFIDAAVRRGDGVYIHCKAGRARSATIVLCWMVRSRGMTVSAAQQLLLERRRHVNPRLAQRPVVRQFLGLVEPAGSAAGSGVAAVSGNVAETEHPDQAHQPPLM